MNRLIGNAAPTRVLVSTQCLDDKFETFFIPQKSTVELTSYGADN